jgi:hypothetical protein
MVPGWFPVLAPEAAAVDADLGTPVSAPAAGRRPSGLEAQIASADIVEEEHAAADRVAIAATPSFRPEQGLLAPMRVGRMLEGQPMAVIACVEALDDHEGTGAVFDAEYRFITPSGW